MSKRRRNLWESDDLQFTNPPQANISYEPIHPIVEETVYLDEAHEALSKLFTKANKRGKQMRGVRRKDAWQ